MAADGEAEAEREANEAREALKRADDAKSKKELEEREADARKRQKELKEQKIRANLKVAIKTRKRQALKTGVSEFKKAKLKDHDGDIPVAENLLKLAEAKERELINSYILERFEGRLSTAIFTVMNADFGSDWVTYNIALREK